jgi:hypothetical protein
MAEAFLLLAMKTKVLFVAFFFSFTISAFASDAASGGCGPNSIPYRLEILSSGFPVLSCSTPSCFGAPQLMDSAGENEVGEGKERIPNKNSTLTMRFRQPQAPVQIAVWFGYPILLL